MTGKRLHSSPLWTSCWNTAPRLLKFRQ